MLKCCFLSSILAIYRKASFRCFFCWVSFYFLFYFKANKPVFKTYKQILVHCLIKLVSSSLLHFSSRSLLCATISVVILLSTSFLVGDSLTLIFCCFYWIEFESKETGGGVIWELPWRLENYCYIPLLCLFDQNIIVCTVNYSGNLLLMWQLNYLVFNCLESSVTLFWLNICWQLNKQKYTHKLVWIKIHIMLFLLKTRVQ